MHGAMYVEGMEDAEGDWISAARALVGDDCTVSASYDLHGNVTQRIIDALDWADIADLVLAPGDGGRGRPYPDLILNALLRTGIDDVAKVAVLGDTTSDILSGLRAGASIVAGTLTGAHDADTLTAAGATHVVASVADFPALFLPLS